ncbi:uncharacterized protein LOC124454947 [Xenia sp. Carnegie-2017]|uniref:uncharacterized protein LOC124454947 n=1 Tax=Xenia sp. Carnegie-2017 TaxID=2897299 RepID=UPI001F04A91E|nr:uncharacterized protein LOC124454947 [Xenia sp. Carnegie-2017]XP_046861665.1 uncharacterized protein LOC124454947 [Xenia sp. Carnegie-2017]
MNHRGSYDGGLPGLPQIPDEDPQYLNMKGRPRALPNIHDRDEETEVCYIDMKSPTCKDTTSTDYVISPSGPAPSNHSEYINVPTYSSDNVQRDANSNVTSCDPEIHSDLLYIDIPPKVPPRSDSQERDNAGIGEPSKPPLRRVQTLQS